MKSLLLTVAMTVLSFVPAHADLITIESHKSVSGSLDAFEGALANAGGTVFARVDHGAGARSIGAELVDAELLIFGNPKLGTPAMQSDIRAGLFLPLKVLAYKTGDGKVILSYEDPADTLSDLDIPADAPYVKMMQGALSNLTAAAAK